MTNAHAEYWREAVMYAFEGCDLWDVIKDVPMEKLTKVGASLATSAEHQSHAFYVPENPMISENGRLSRKLKWERERTTCQTCNGRGVLEYSAGPWWVTTGCDTCNSSGKVHPHGEREPA